MNTQTDTVKRLTPAERSAIQKTAQTRAFEMAFATGILLIGMEYTLRGQAWFKRIPTLAKPILFGGGVLFAFVRGGQVAMRQATHDVYMKHAHGQ